MSSDPSRASGVDVRNLSCSFGGLQAVRNVSINVEPGTFVGLIGPNGAGKTTLLECVSGHNRTYAGRVFLEGVETTKWPPHKIGSLGVIRTFQVARPFAKLTILSNLMTGPRNQKGEGLVSAILGNWRHEQRELLQGASSWLRRFELEDAANSYGGELSGGQERLAELSRAMMAEPTMLLLDEPFAGVSPVNRLRLAEYLKKVSQERSLTVLMVEHRLEFIEKLCSRVLVMAEGEIIADGDMSEIRRDKRVLEAYLGVV
jgi:ABC-type branched-subunit amino acid transport system ATPase component